MHSVRPIRLLKFLHRYDYTKSTLVIGEVEKGSIVAIEQYIDKEFGKVSSEHLKNDIKTEIENEARFKNNNTNLFTVFADPISSLRSSVDFVSKKWNLFSEKGGTWRK